MTDMRLEPTRSTWNLDPVPETTSDFSVRELQVTLKLFNFYKIGQDYEDTECPGLGSHGKNALQR